MAEKNKQSIIQQILSIGKEKDLGEYNRKLLNRVWNSEKRKDK